MTLTNTPEFSVSDLSGALKRVVETNFSHVRVRGEIGGYRGPHSSGHCYFSLKDEKAKIDAIIWRGVFGRLKYKPEEGMEVIATGKLSTFAGKSSYQIIIDSLEPAGEGALMALLEKRKKELAAEGLFAQERKKPLPFMPQTIGVVTSPTGAVIRDILHRLADRMPSHVLLWPVAVQGDAAAEQVAHAVAGFNALSQTPDLLIVARGGGSIEDLWPFNEEIVARAVAASNIPVISAVGHETDTTLIDFVSDMRAPTPTAAAEMAVPVRADLLYTLRDHQQRMDSLLTSTLSQSQQHLEGLSRGLPKPMELLSQAAQQLDSWAERLQGSLGQMLQQKQAKLREAQAALRPASLQKQWNQQQERLEHQQGLLARALASHIERKRQLLQRVELGLRPANLLQPIAQHEQQLQRLTENLSQRVGQQIERKSSALQRLSAQLRLLDYHHVLQRGFALVRDGEGALVTKAQSAKQAQSLILTFADGEAELGAVSHVSATTKTPCGGGGEEAEKPIEKIAKKTAKKVTKKPSGTSGNQQESLF